MKKEMLGFQKFRLIFMQKIKTPFKKIGLCISYFKHYFCSWQVSVLCQNLLWKCIFIFPIEIVTRKNRLHIQFVLIDLDKKVAKINTITSVSAKVWKENTFLFFPLRFWQKIAKVHWRFNSYFRSWIKSFNIMVHFLELPPKVF